MKRFWFIVLLILMASVSCTREERAVPVGECGLIINFGTGVMLTRGTPGDGDVSDGGGIFISEGEPDLVILIANNASGSIVGKYPDPLPDSGVDSSLEAGAESTEMSVKFTGLDAGPHTVYAFANTGGYWDMEGQGASTAKNYLLSLGTASAVEALRFSDLFADVAASVCPNDDDSNAPVRLPLSAKGVVNVTAQHTGQVSLEMLRCVAKVTVVFINNTAENLTLYDYSNKLTGLCPNRGYVIEHDPDYPAGALAGDILSSESSVYIPAVDPIDSHKAGSVSRSWYVFPSSGPYTCDIAFTLFKGEDDEHEYTYSDLPVHDDHAVSIPSLPRNRHLHIVTKISKGTTVSFNFEVSGWGSPFEERVLFD